ncbi:MAG: HAMP domain-containing histidine kinase [Candidatus Cloacimonetes bacterium]|nr:HAMP domain-containing histidine kinase [Candidatus Cloacimonadota bacterium]MBS3767573.1 HAMP domain-containing histidine kinase [Candidatus Cloacimonadota bacterium]
MVLSLVHKIIDDYNGDIKVSSKINQGTQFTITLPKSGGNNYG